MVMLMADSTTIMRDVSFSMENGILIGNFRDDMILNLETAINEVGVNLTTSAGLYHPFLLELSSVRSFTHEAIQYLLFSAGVKYFSAVAIVAGPIWARLFLKIIKTLQSPAMPVKLFNNRSEALDWLKNLDSQQDSLYSDQFDGRSEIQSV